MTCIEITEWYEQSNSIVTGYIPIESDEDAAKVTLMAYIIDSSTAIRYSLYQYNAEKVQISARSASSGQYIDVLSNAKYFRFELETTIAELFSTIMYMDLTYETPLTLETTKKKAYHPTENNGSIEDITYRISGGSASIQTYSYTLEKSGDIWNIIESIN